MMRQPACHPLVVLTSSYPRLRLKNPCRFPCHDKSPSLEGGETRKQRIRDGLGRRLLLLEVVGEGFSTLQTHAKDSGQTCLGIVV